MSKSPLQFIESQIVAAKQELKSYAPREVDWFERARGTAMRLVPLLANEVAKLRDFVDHVMNSPNDVRIAVADILAAVEINPELSKRMKIKKSIDLLRSSLDSEKLLLSGANGTVVSKLIERHLIQSVTDWNLESNGSSDYPDLFFRSDDYSALPDFKRGATQSYGAALKGKAKRPVRIPDGLEIKTCNRKFAVDCHHAHVGLHLVLIFQRQKSRFSVLDVQIGFLRKSLYLHYQAFHSNNDSKGVF